MYQQAANYLQQFVDKAPDAHKFKADAKAVLEALKSQQNVQAEKPAKTSTPTAVTLGARASCPQFIRFRLEAGNARLFF